MTEKIVITQDVADAIERFRNADFTDFGILVSLNNEVVGRAHNLEGERQTIRSWSYKCDGDNADKLIDALRIGYEVEFIENLAIGEIVKYVDIETEGNICGVVTRIEKNGISEERDQIFACWDGKDFDGYMRRDRVFKCTDEEIRMVKERQLWKSIGREVGELKEGDIGISGFGIKYEKRMDLVILHRGGNLVGLYPVESFISFEEGEEG